MEYFTLLVFFVLLLGLFIPIPKIFEIIRTKDSSNESLGEWSIAWLVSFSWLLYGFANRDLLVIFDGATGVLFLGILIFVIQEYKN
jgi:uncharacterized protein with PQ loop repeat